MTGLQSCGPWRDTVGDHLDVKAGLSFTQAFQDQHGGGDCGLHWTCASGWCLYPTGKEDRPVPVRHQGRPVRGIGESPWDKVRSPAEAQEPRYRERLAQQRLPPWPGLVAVLCPYDVAHDKASLAAMARCHFELRRDGRTMPSEDDDPQAPFRLAPLTGPCDPCYPCDPCEELTYGNEQGGCAPASRP